MNTETTRIYAPLVLRLSLAAVFLAHGLAKVFLYTVPGTVEFFEAVGFAGFLAYPVILAEVGGGLMLLAGVASRWVALGLVPVALGATSVHWANGFLFTNPSGGWELPAFLAVISLVHFLLGEDGPFSLAAVLRVRTAARA